MRSIPRSKAPRIRGAIPYVIAFSALTLLVLGVFTGLGQSLFAWAIPAQPQGPRYSGAGHDEPQYGGTFMFHHETNVRSLDPLKAWDELSFMAIRHLYDGLVDFDYEANVVPSLTIELPEVSEDGRTFTFRLRQGVHFHNGRELTAEDVRWSMERMMHPLTGSPGYSFYSAITGADAFHNGTASSVEGIRVLDSHTIEFQLDEPEQTFLAAMGMPFAYPVAHENYPEFVREREGAPETVREYPPGETPDPSKNAIGTGPFHLTSWERGVQLVFDRNEDYWQPGLPYTDRMIYRENMPRHIAVMRFRTGDLDAVHRFSAPDYLIIKSQPGWVPYTQEKPKVNLWGLAMNTQMEPFDNVHLRRAVAFAMNRERWNRARAGRLNITGQPVPPQLMGYDPELENRQYYDLDRAREEMALAGHPVEMVDGRPKARGLDRITMWTTEHETSRAYGELAQFDLAQIGIEMEIHQVAFALFLEQTGRPGIAQMVFTGWGMDFPDPSNFFDSLWHGRLIQPRDCQNRSFYNNPELNALLDRARAEVDRDRRRELYVEASNIVAGDAPWAFGWNDMWFEAWQPYVRNYRQHPVWAQEYRFVWLDEPRRRVAASYRGAFAPSRTAMLSPFGGL